MPERPSPRFQPDLERLEAKQLLAAAAPTAGEDLMGSGPPALTSPPPSNEPPRLLHTGGGQISARAKKPNFGYLVYRITNPTGGPVNTLTPPFGHVLVQARQPIPGQVYNILQITVKNTTHRTFDSSSGFAVRLPDQRYTPILTGNEQWKPGQDFVFYALTKKYYPLANQVSDGFQFKLGGAWSVAIPGPSGIFLRIKYNPDTINKILDYAATRGPGAQGGKGIPFGMPDTALWAFASAKQNRNDFGGYF